MERRRVTENLDGPTDLHIKATLLTIIFKGKASTNGLTRENSTATGSTIKCTGMECSLGLTAASTKANILMTKKKAEEFSPGQTIGSMMACG